MTTVLYSPVGKFIISWLFGRLFLPGPYQFSLAFHAALVMVFCRASRRRARYSGSV